MQSEQQLAEGAEQDAVAKAKAEADAALMALGPSTSNSAQEQPQLEHSESRPVAVNSSDAMELCSTAELVELFAEYTAADVQQLKEDYLVSESHCDVDLDIFHPALEMSGVPGPVSVVARAQLGDSNEDVDFSALISRS